MPLLAKEQGTQFPPTPEGIHLAVCYMVADLGTHLDELYSKDRRQVVIGWELPQERIEVERDGEKVDLPRAISKRYTLSLSDRATLRHDLEAWRGRAFTAKELDGFDLEKVIGSGCQMQVIHAQNTQGREYAKINSIMALIKGTPVPKLENEPIFFSLDDFGGGDLPENLPKWVKEEIGKSFEYGGGKDEPVAADVDAMTEAPVLDEAETEDEDNLPF